MPIRVLNHIPDDSGLRAQWNALVLQTRNPQVFYTWEWAAAVQRAYSAELQPVLCLGYDDGDRLCGVAALASDAAQRISFLCATTGDYCDFIAREPDAAPFANEVIRTLLDSGHQDVVLTNFPEDSPAFAAVSEASRRYGYRTYARTAYVCSQIGLAELRESSSRTPLPRQKMVRRSLRAMGGAAAPVTVNDSEWETVGPLLPEFFRAHVARFLFTDRISNLVRPERREFLVELAGLLSPTGWLCLTRMSAGLRTIAWNYGFRFRATWFWYQPTFVNDLEKYSPGFVLLYKLTERAAQDGSVEIVDLGLGAEAYKEAFANASRRTMYVTLHQSRLKHWREIGRYRAATAIARWPWAERTTRTLRATLDKFRRRVRENAWRATLGWFWSRARRWIFLREEVFFFEGCEAATEGTESGPLRGQVHPSLRAMTYELLAEAAIQSCDDEATIRYAMRSVRRLREGKAEGFVLTDGDRPVHLAWVTDFDGFFLSELNAKVDAPSPDCVMLFDCWTPSAARGRGYYGRAVGLMAKQMRERQKKPWIFSASGNVASLRGLEKTGFQRRYSLVRQRILGWQKISGKIPAAVAAAPAEVSAPV